ncbi:DNA primase catalytic core [Saccharopolyspora lacisalsi]|uniref:DNA primase catalytic core n=1 Tax=Halosaccharopolyspora lacisalsi TaxID=1000566 RepID=A0A839E798_9PSEU|nr:helicase-related protein [Halosaccharopolyspora lacisalsi]MBA8827785.1 DNA primase catalytic core [Halosaccharopolyspora lacisalsi]
MSSETSTPEPPGPPRGEISRARAGIAALQTAQRLSQLGATSTAEDWAALRTWPGWGPLAKALSPEPSGTWADLQGELLGLLSPHEYQEGFYATPNAFYTPPVVADAMHRLLGDLGFDGGRVLEPGCGAGQFLARSPEGTDIDWVGIERDPSTARIAALLHPHATIRNSPLEETALPLAEAALGNVPFENTRVHDPNPQVPQHVKRNLHNYVLWRTVEALRPGGVAVLLTSRYTLDAQARNGRAALAMQADLLGAIRLPSGALADGGTDAITDVMVLRKRLPTEPTPTDPDEVPWLHAETHPQLDQPVNRIFLDHPEWVLGEMTTTHGHKYGQTLHVEPHADSDLASQLSQVSTQIVAQSRKAGMTFQAARHDPAAELASVPLADADGRPEGSFHVFDGTAYQVTGGALAPVMIQDQKASKEATQQAKQQARDHGQDPQAVAEVRIDKGPLSGKPLRELATLTELRDATVELLEAEADHSRSDEELVPLRARLNERYDAYVAEFGYLNRATVTTTTTSPKSASAGEETADGQTGLPKVTRKRPYMGGFAADPDYPAVLALEDFDDATNTGQKAAIFHRRLNVPPRRAEHADSPDEAVRISLDETGQVDLDRIGGLLDCPTEQVPGRLGELVYYDPALQRWMAREDYLAGDVVTKLEQARAAAEQAPEHYDRNVAALEHAQPRALTPEEITAPLGAPWIPPDVVTQFCADVLDENVEITYTPELAKWQLTRRDAQRSVAATFEWGTDRVDGVRLVELALDGKTPTVKDDGPDPDSKPVTNQGATQAAQAKQVEIGERFSDWVWQDPARAERLVTRYNRRFNSYVNRVYSGQHLTFTGLDADFHPYDHQREMVHRILANPTALCGHAVGGGKTATMYLSALKMREQGLAHKPLIVVPNHLLEQVTRDGKRFFPGAKILMAGEQQLGTKNDLSQRKLFAARCATGDWDAIVMTHTAFESIPVSPETQSRYLAESTAELEDALRAHGGEESKQAKALAKALKRKTTTLKDNLAASRSDTGITLEMLGVDYLLLDEAHYFKNLHLSASDREISLPKGSNRATDLDNKLAHLRRTNPTGRVATFFTGTPLSNNLVEIYVMQHYLQPERLKQMGVGQLDPWLRTFVRVEPRLEIGLDGVSFRQKNRPVGFHNPADLMAVFNEIGDVRGQDDLGLKRPEARSETVVVEPSDRLTGYVAGIAERIDKMSSTSPDVDNMLKVCSDGRKAAVDLDLVGVSDPEPGKVESVVSRMAAIYHRTKDQVFPNGQRGGLQLGFCDLGTPNQQRGDQVYGKIRDGLVTAGVPANKIRFIHEATTDGQKATLFAQARSGEVAVLLGSTDKMGVGTNVQDLIVAMHHIDAPWRPADIEQRNGRGLRVGNQMLELDQPVEVLKFVAEGSFDSYMWQTLERKAWAVTQLFGGNPGREDLDIDLDDTVMDMSEAKALATGNPLLERHAKAKQELTRLQRLSTSHARTQADLEHNIETWQQQSQELSRRVRRLRTLAETAEASTHHWVHQDSALPDDKTVNETLGGILTRAMAGTSRYHGRLSYRDVRVEIRARQDLSAWRLEATLGGSETVSLKNEWVSATNQYWRITQAITDHIDQARDHTAELQSNVDDLQNRIDSGRGQLGAPFPQAEELRQARVQLTQIEADMDNVETDTGTSAAPTEHDPPGDSDHTVIDATADGDAAPIAREQPAGAATPGQDRPGEIIGVAIGADGSSRRVDVAEAMSTPEQATEQAPEAGESSAAVMSAEHAQRLAEDLIVEDLVPAESAGPLRQAAWWLLIDAELTRLAREDTGEQDLASAVQAQTRQYLSQLRDDADSQLLRPLLRDEDFRNQVLDRLTRFTIGHLRPTLAVEDPSTPDTATLVEHPLHAPITRLLDQHQITASETDLAGLLRGLDQLTEQPRIIQAARANALDNYGDVIGKWVKDLIVDIIEAAEPEGPSTAFLAHWINDSALLQQLTILYQRHSHAVLNAPPDETDARASAPAGTASPFSGEAPGTPHETQQEQAAAHAATAEASPSPAVETTPGEQAGPGGADAGPAETSAEAPAAVGNDASTATTPPSGGGNETGDVAVTTTAEHLSGNAARLRELADTLDQLAETAAGAAEDGFYDRDGILIPEEETLNGVAGDGGRKRPFFWRGLQISTVSYAGSRCQAVISLPHGDHSTSVLFDAGWLRTGQQPVLRQALTAWLATLPNTAAQARTDADQHDQADLVIAHDETGTAVRGTQRGDRQLTETLKRHSFRFSTRQQLWYLPRPWKYPTRSNRVRDLTRDLQDQQRLFRLDDGQPGPAPTSSPEKGADPTTEPAQQPVTDTDAQSDVRNADTASATFSDWANDAPETGVMTTLRQLADEHGLQQSVLQLDGVRYVTLSEPGAAAMPLVSYSGGESVTVARGDHELAIQHLAATVGLYRDAVRPGVFTLDTTVPQWPLRVAQLAAHTQNGPHFHRAVRDELNTAIRLAGQGRSEEAQRWLSQAEQSAPPLVVMPHRAAQLRQSLTGLIEQGDVPTVASAAERVATETGTAVTEREQPTLVELVTQHTSANPELREATQEASRQDRPGDGTPAEDPASADNTDAEMPSVAALPTAEPYTSTSQALDDLHQAGRARSDMDRTAAGQRLSPSRSDVSALWEAERDARGLRKASAGESVAGYARWAQAARMLAANLEAEGLRAPAFWPLLTRYVETVQRLAARTKATSEQVSLSEEPSTRNSDRDPDSRTMVPDSSETPQAEDPDQTVTTAASAAPGDVPTTPAPAEEELFAVIPETPQRFSGVPTMAALTTTLQQALPNAGTPSGITNTVTDPATARGVLSRIWAASVDSRFAAAADSAHTLLVSDTAVSPYDRGRRLRADSSLSRQEFEYRLRVAEAVAEVLDAESVGEAATVRATGRGAAGETLSASVRAMVAAARGTVPAEQAPSEKKTAQQSATDSDAEHAVTDEHGQTIADRLRATRLRHKQTGSPPVWTAPAPQVRGDITVTAAENVRIGQVVSYSPVSRAVEDSEPDQQAPAGRRAAAALLDDARAELAERSPAAAQALQQRTTGTGLAASQQHTTTAGAPEQRETVERTSAGDGEIPGQMAIPVPGESAGTAIPGEAPAEAPASEAVDATAGQTSGQPVSTVLASPAPVRADVLVAGSARGPIATVAAYTRLQTPDSVPGTRADTVPVEDEEPTPEPLTDQDIAETLFRLAPHDLVDLVATLDVKHTQRRITAGWGHHSWRPATAPDAGANEVIQADRTGLHIRVSTPTFIRQGHRSWTELQTWLRSGLTPGRERVLLHTARTLQRYEQNRLGFTITDQKDACTHILRGLAAQQSSTITAIVEAALSSRQRGEPTPARPTSSSQEAGLFDVADVAISEHEAALLARLDQLATVLPATSTSHVAISQLQPGWVLTRGQLGLSNPLTVTEPAEDHGDYLALHGQYLGGLSTEPRTKHVYKNGRTEPPVAVVNHPGRLDALTTTETSPASAQDRPVTAAERDANDTPSAPAESAQQDHQPRPETTPPERPDFATVTRTDTVLAIAPAHPRDVSVRVSRTGAGPARADLVSYVRHAATTPAVAEHRSVVVADPGVPRGEIRMGDSPREAGPVPAVSGYVRLSSSLGGTDQPATAPGTEAEQVGLFAAPEPARWPLISPTPGVQPAPAAERAHAADLLALSDDEVIARWERLLELADQRGFAVWRTGGGNPVPEPGVLDVAYGLTNRASVADLERLLAWQEAGTEQRQLDQVPRALAQGSLPPLQLATADGQANLPSREDPDALINWVVELLDYTWQPRTTRSITTPWGLHRALQLGMARTGYEVYLHRRPNIVVDEATGEITLPRRDESPDGEATQIVELAETLVDRLRKRRSALANQAADATSASIEPLLARHRARKEALADHAPGHDREHAAESTGDGAAPQPHAESGPDTAAPTEGFPPEPTAVQVRYTRQRGVELLGAQQLQLPQDLSRPSEYSTLTDHDIGEWDWIPPQQGDPGRWRMRGTQGAALDEQQVLRLVRCWHGLQFGDLDTDPPQVTISDFADTQARSTYLSLVHEPPAPVDGPAPSGTGTGTLAETDVAMALVFLHQQGAGTFATLLRSRQDEQARTDLTQQRGEGPARQHPQGFPDEGALSRVDLRGRGLGITVATPDGAVRAGERTWAQLRTFLQPVTDGQQQLFEAVSALAQRWQSSEVAGPDDPQWHHRRHDVHALHARVVRFLIGTALYPPADSDTTPRNWETQAWNQLRELDALLPTTATPEETTAEGATAPERGEDTEQTLLTDPDSPQDPAAAPPAAELEDTETTALPASTTKDTATGDETAHPPVDQLGLTDTRAGEHTGVPVEQEWQAWADAEEPDSAAQEPLTGQESNEHGETAAPAQARPSGWVLAGPPPHPPRDVRVGAPHADSPGQVADYVRLTTGQPVPQALDVDLATRRAHPATSLPQPRGFIVGRPGSPATTRAIGEPVPSRDQPPAAEAAASPPAPVTTAPPATTAPAEQTAPPDEPTSTKANTATTVWPAPATGEPELDRLAAVNTLAAAWFADQLDQSRRVQTYLASNTRLGSHEAVAAVRERTLVGYGPRDWTGLIEHLRQAGFSEDDMLDAGVATRSSRTGDVITAFYDRITFGIRDESGRLAGFTGRDVSGRASAKYRNTSTTALFHKGQLLFGAVEQRQQLARAERVVVCEGPFDAAAITATAALAGRSDLVAVAACGTAVTTAHLQQLQRVMDPQATLVIGADNDANNAGRQAGLATVEQALLVTSLSVDYAQPPERGHDPASWALRKGGESLRLYTTDAQHGLDVLIEERVRGRERADANASVEDSVAAAHAVATFAAQFDLTAGPRRSELIVATMQAAHRTLVDPTTMPELIAHYQAPEAPAAAQPSPQPVETASPAASPPDSTSGTAVDHASPAPETPAGSSEAEAVPDSQSAQAATPPPPEPEPTPAADQQPVAAYSQALATITPAAVRQYLQETGWADTGATTSGAAAVFTRVVDGQPCDVLVPSSNQQRDWPRRISELLSTLEEAETPQGRDWRVILRELAEADTTPSAAEPGAATTEHTPVPAAAEAGQQAPAEPTSTSTDPSPAGGNASGPEFAPQPTHAATPASADGTRQLVLHHSRHHGLLLYGTQNSDHIGDLLHLQRLRGHAIGQWRWDPSKPTPDGGHGAWHVSGSAGRLATPATVHALHHVQQTLTETGLQARIDLAETDADPDAWTQHTADQAPADETPNTATTTPEDEPVARCWTSSETHQWSQSRLTSYTSADRTTRVDLAELDGRWALQVSTELDGHQLQIRTSLRDRERADGVSRQATTQPAKIPQLARDTVTVGAADVWVDDTPLPSHNPLQTLQQTLSQPAPQSPPAASSPRSGASRTTTAAATAAAAAPAPRSGTGQPPSSLSRPPTPPPATTTTTLPPRNQSRYAP